MIIMKCKNCGAELGVNGYCAYCGSYLETTTKEDDCLMHKYVLKDLYDERVTTDDGFKYILHHYIIKCVHCGLEKDIVEDEYTRLFKMGIIVDRKEFMKSKVKWSF